jgi:hypothetical protein
MTIEHHLLKGEGIKFTPSPNHGEKFLSGYLDTIVLNYTRELCEQSAIDTFTDPATKFSDHMLISKDGSIRQLVHFNEIAWHGSTSSYGGRSRYNNYSLGIEIVNPGHLTKVGNQYQAWHGGKFGEDKVIQSIHRNESSPGYWCSYTEKQIVPERNPKYSKRLFQRCAYTFFAFHGRIGSDRRHHFEFRKGKMKDLMTVFQMMLAFYFGSKIMHHLASTDMKKTEAIARNISNTTITENLSTTDFEETDSVG